MSSTNRVLILTGNRAHPKAATTTYVASIARSNVVVFFELTVNSRLLPTKQPTSVTACDGERRYYLIYPPSWEFRSLVDQ